MPGHTQQGLGIRVHSVSHCLCEPPLQTSVDQIFTFPLLYELPSSPLRSQTTTSHIFLFFFSFFKVLLKCSYLQCDGVSDIQQSDSVIHICTSILFQILFLHRLSQNTGWSSLCHTAGPHWTIIPDTSVCICQSQPPSPSLSHSHLSSLVTKSLFSKSVSLFLFCK